jgi:hypothetical protein
MFGIVFKFLGVAIALLVVVFGIADTFRKARRLDARIQEFKREQEELAKQRGPANPYADLAELYAEPTRRKSGRDRRP